MSIQNQTVSDVEASIQTSLHTLSNLPFNDDVRAGLQHLFQPGFETVVELEEVGRTLRRNTPASSLDPEKVEIVIRFERLTQVPPGVPAPESGTGVPSERQIQECCVALAEEEKAGKAFIALKWFRDNALPNYGFGWANDSEERQRVLEAAINAGRIKTSKRHNPNSPNFPTTVVSLNRSEPLPGVRSRFRPVPVKGEPVSTTLLRDRGSY